MALGLMGRKCGMTRVFTDEGESIPVTVVKVEPNSVTQIKTVDKEGYNALQLTVGYKRASRVSKPLAGHFAKANVEPGRVLFEHRVDEKELKELKLGTQFTVELFKVGQKIDVTGTSKGKGFAGVVKRWNFSMQRATHGNSLSHRAPGSIGQCQTPGRVFKGKKMAGQMGNEQVTIQNLEVIQIEAQKNLIFIKGAVPGAIGTNIALMPTEKQTQSETAA